MVAAYRAGTTSASLATTHELSLSSVKRMLAAARVRDNAEVRTSAVRGMVARSA